MPPSSSIKLCAKLILIKETLPKTFSLKALTPFNPILLSSKLISLRSIFLNKAFANSSAPSSPM